MRFTSIDDIEPLMMRASVIALGPGLGQDGWAMDLFRRILDGSAAEGSGCRCAESARRESLLNGKTGF